MNIEKISDKEFQEKFYSFQSQRLSLIDLQITLPEEDKLLLSSMRKFSDSYINIEIYLVKHYENFKKIPATHNLSFEELVKNHSKTLDNFGKIALLSKFLSENYIQYCLINNKESIDTGENFNKQTNESNFGEIYNELIFARQWYELYELSYQTGKISYNKLTKTTKNQVKELNEKNTRFIEYINIKKYQRYINDITKKLSTPKKFELLLKNLKEKRSKLVSLTNKSKNDYDLVLIKSSQKKYKKLYKKLQNFTSIIQLMNSDKANLKKQLKPEVISSINNSYFPKILNQNSDLSDLINQLKEATLENALSENIIGVLENYSFGEESQDNIYNEIKTLIDKIEECSKLIVEND